MVGTPAWCPMVNGAASTAGDVSGLGDFDGGRSDFDDGDNDGSGSHVSSDFFAGRYVPRRGRGDDGGGGGGSGGSGSGLGGGSSSNRTTRRSTRTTSVRQQGHREGDRDREPRYRSGMLPKTLVYDGSKDTKAIENYKRKVALW